MATGTLNDSVGLAIEDVGDESARLCLRQLQPLEQVAVIEGAQRRLAYSKLRV